MGKRRLNSIVGLEIEPAAVHAAQVSVNGTIAIERAAVAPLEPGIVRDGEVNDVDGLAEALRELYRDSKGLERRVRIGLANQKIVVRLVDLPPITDSKELAAAVRFAAQDEIPMPLDAAVLDYHALGIVETPAGPRQRVLLVAARRDMVERVLTAARAAGLRVEGIDLSAFAMVRALHTVAPGAGGPVLYLSIGGMTNLAVAEGTNCVFTRVIGGGLEGIAIELAETVGIALPDARELLETTGLVPAHGESEGDNEDFGHSGAARAALESGVRRIAAEVRASLDFHRSQDAAARPVGGAVLTGAAASVPGFAAAFSAELGMEVAIADVAGAPDDIGSGLLAVAAGLAVEEAVA